jgi:hypothetical protein
MSFSGPTAMEINKNNTAGTDLSSWFEATLLERTNVGRIFQFRNARARTKSGKTAIMETSGVKCAKNIVAHENITGEGRVFCASGTFSVPGMPHSLNVVGCPYWLSFAIQQGYTTLRNLDCAFGLVLGLTAQSKLRCGETCTNCRVATRSMPRLLS